jgi:Flp pilus assembly pilin Flp
MKRISQKIRQRGQGMTEYIIIVALIAVAAIAVYQLLAR